MAVAVLAAIGGIAGLALPHGLLAAGAGAADGAIKVTLRFTLEHGAGAAPQLFDDQASLGVAGAPRENPSHAVHRDGQGSFAGAVALRTEKPLQVVMHRAVRDGYRQVAEASIASVCLKAPVGSAGLAPSVVALNCTEGGTCAPVSDADGAWISACSDRAGIAPAAPAGAWTRLAALLVGEAHADTLADESWAVPSLESLMARAAELTEGFTAFTVGSAAPLHVDADGVAVDLTANGRPVMVEGLPGEALVQPFDPNAPLALHFALQNLDFDGRRAGCDDVGVRLRFYKGGAETGAPVDLGIRYAALGDNPPTEAETGVGPLVWSAFYNRSTRPSDWRVFVQSVRLGSWDDADTPAGAAAVGRLEQTRRAIDAMGLAFSGKPVVAIMRAPLSSPAWGLALGTVEGTGQVDFTFSKAEAGDLLAAVNAARAGDPAIRAVLPDEPYLYVEKEAAGRVRLCVP